MIYSQFINTIETYQTQRIKPLCLPDSCAPEKIPSIFSNLLPDLIEILEANFNELSNGKPILGIFGFQVASFGIESSIPFSQNRIFSSSYAKMHLCCSLSYLTTTKEELSQKNDWSGAQNIIIDFTRGFVMNNEHYIHELCHKGAFGKIFGKLNHTKLNQVWQTISKTQPTYSSIN